jgi:hypothetical protein
MTRKIIFAISITMLAVFGLSGAVAAEDLSVQESDGRGSVTVGQVFQIQEESFSIEKQDGEQLKVLVSDRTRFRSREEQSEASYSDLSVGRWVAVGGAMDDGEITAIMVVLLPEDFEPGNIPVQKTAGEVAQIILGQDTFSITTRDGEEFSFLVNDNTQFRNELESLQDLEKGMRVLVLAVEQEDGSLLARVVAKAENLRRTDSQKAAGLLDEFDGNSLTIQLRGGATQSFTVTGETAFRSPDGSAESLSDLETGHILAVVYQGEADGSLTALIVIAGGEDLNQAIRNLERAFGEVQSAGGSHLTIQTREGETLKFQVDETTRIASPSGTLELNEIKNGMRVLVLSTVGDDGDLIARGVLVRQGERTNAPGAFQKESI